jgi:RNA polymerase primary sigma factor
MPFSRNDDTEFNLYDFLQTGNIPSPDNNMMKDSIATNIKRALNKLSQREATIIIMSFGLCNTPVYSLHDIAIKFGMTSERVRQIRNKGILKLKSLLKGKYALLEY